MSAAEVTTFRLDTFVLNAGFDKPALLARDVAGVDLLTDGRFEFGLGASTALSPRTDSSSLRHL
jgi:alkanesulfonate monooxygenase SsuD/methylene tetrahydromethanopterin reductase-like flavin-dependent oxidoreductase (luciferase family)